MIGMFDPDSITKEDMINLGKHIENYIDILETHMSIPHEIMDECEDQLKEGIKRAKKLVKKLKKGDKSVFKDADDEN